MVREVNNRSGSLVDPDWVAAHGNDPDVCLIEIAGMSPEEVRAYEKGHVPGAHSWKWQEMLWDSQTRDFPSPEEFARRMGEAGIGNDTTVVFYGEGLQFGIYAWWVFRYCGHRDVRVLDGGRYKWSAEGRPLVTGVPPPRHKQQYRPAKRVERMRILRDDLLRALDEERTVILDGRSPEEYRGERVSGPGGFDHGAIRYGRIPGAKHLYFDDLFEADKSFKSREELTKLFESRGASSDCEIIVYCRLSHRATVLYFALVELLGLENVRVYDGSWTEWGNLVGVPIER